jgi:hypothetical protein
METRAKNVTLFVVYLSMISFSVCFFCFFLDVELINFKGFVTPLTVKRRCSITEQGYMLLRSVIIFFAETAGGGTDGT